MMLEYFPRYLAFIDSTEQQISIPIDKNKRKMYYSGLKKKYVLKIQVMVNNRGFIIYKTAKERGRRGMTMTFIKRISSCNPKISC
jgi:hypothetical protein